ncbi:hypothetical protein SLE2022_280850 [Rubroshorea leprosula]
MGERVLNIRLTPASRNNGVASVSKRHVVRRLPTFEGGHRSAVLIARDAHQEGVEHRFCLRKRANEAQPKETLTGMKEFFDQHELQAGDQIMIDLLREEVKLFGRVIRSALYQIDFRRRPIA